MAKTIKDLQKEVIDFCDERSWIYKDPNHLISAITIELGELAENFQWKNEFIIENKNKKTEMEYEFVDILFYLSLLASKCDVDLECAFNEKLPKLAKKFPVGKETLDANSEYRAKGKNKIYD